MTGMRQLLAQLRDMQSTMPPNCRVVPSSFDPTDTELLALLRPLHFDWRSCRHILESAGSRAVANRMPIFWQMQSALHDACRPLGIPIFLSEPANVALGAVSLALADVDTVVSEARDIDALIAYVRERNLPPPRVCIAIHRLEDAWQIPEHAISSVSVVAQEVHLLPTIPLLVQCIALARAISALYHLSETIEWTFRGEEASISSADPLLSISNLDLPDRLAHRGVCACRAALYQRV